MARPAKGSRPQGEGGDACLIPRPGRSRSRSCATAPSRKTSRCGRAYTRALHRRHVGAAGLAAHQGLPRRHPELPLVVPHGDLRQLRDDDRRQAASCRARPSCATCCRARCASRRWRTSRSSATWSSASTTSSRSSKASSPTSSRRSRARWPRASTCRRPQQLERYEQFSSCINCMLCYAACPQYGLDPDFIGPGRAGAAAPLQRRFARRRPRRAHGDPQRRGRACGAAPRWATAPRSAPSTSTRPTR